MNTTICAKKTKKKKMDKEFIQKKLENDIKDIDKNELIKEGIFKIPSKERRLKNERDIV